MVKEIIYSPANDLKDEVTFFKTWGTGFKKNFDEALAAKKFELAAINRRLYLACADAVHIINNEPHRAHYYTYADLEEALKDFASRFEVECKLYEMNPVAVQKRLEIIDNFLKNRRGTVLPKQLNLFSE